MISRGRKWLIPLFSLLLMAGCGRSTEATTVESQEEEMTEATEETSLEDEIIGLLEAAEQENGTNKMEIEFASEEENPSLALFLAELYEIPVEEQSSTRYYYNKIDINGDGRKEIFAVVIGAYTEGEKGGNPAAILGIGENQDYIVLAQFPEIKTPVYVLEDTTGGWRNLIFDVYGIEDHNRYVRYCYQEGAGYTEDLSETIETINGIAGTQILSNNLIDDMDQGRYFTLLPVVEESEQN